MLININYQKKFVKSFLKILGRERKGDASIYFKIGTHPIF